MGGLGSLGFRRFEGFTGCGGGALVGRFRLHGDSGLGFNPTFRGLEFRVWGLGGVGFRGLGFGVF